MKGCDTESTLIYEVTSHRSGYSITSRCYSTGLRNVPHTFWLAAEDAVLRSVWGVQQKPLLTVMNLCFCIAGLSYWTAPHHTGVSVFLRVCLDLNKRICWYKERPSACLALTRISYTHCDTIWWELRIQIRILLPLPSSRLPVHHFPSHDSHLNFI